MQPGGSLTFLFPARLFAYATIFAVGGDPRALVGRVGETSGPLSVIGGVGTAGLADRRCRGARAADGPLFGWFIALG